jgi:DNA polymerase-3 subunit delta'
MPFRDVVGHQAILTLLARATARGALPQSLIFSGPEGVGKRLAAVALAQALNCMRLSETRGTAADEFGAAADEAAEAGQLAVDACGECSVCRRIAQGNHPDVLLIQPDIGIDAVRDAVETAGYRPFEGRRRVFVFDDADRLSPEIQNSLLKTLEEPPPSASFVLVTGRQELLLPTVRSRCPMLRFGRLPLADVERLLREREGLDAARAHAAAVASDGSLGRALAEASSDGELSRQLVEQVLRAMQGSRAPADRLRAAGLLLEPGEAKPAARGPKGKGKTANSRAASDRDLLGQRLKALGATLRDLSVLASGADERSLATDLSADARTLLRQLDVDRLVASYDAVGRAQQALDRNVSPKTVVDWLAFQL